METNKDFLAQNLIKYRKAHGLTQADLAQKINYSDKAVSKWERAEAVPDVFVLQSIANIYGISLDRLINESPEKKAKVQSKIELKRFLITLLSVILAWLVAIVVYVTLSLCFEDQSNKLYITLLLAVPVSAIIMLVFSSVWHKKWMQFFSISILIWTTLLVIYLLFIENLLIFLIGLPLQGLDFFFYLYKQLS